MRRLWALVCALTLLAATPALADKRVALVVGNGAYEHADTLANPTRDAGAMRDKLAALGFDVIYGENLKKRDFERLIGRFAVAAEGADVALAYYAGHGATFADTPYLVPVDAEFASLNEMPYELIPVEAMVGELRRASGVRIAILDACRDNAAEQALKRTATRGGQASRGLERIRNPDGLILAYATQYNTTAADGAQGQNSPFTAALLDRLAAPGLDIKDLFFRVGADVIKATGGRQRPEISISMFDSYALVPSASAPPVAPNAPPRDAPPIVAQVDRSGSPADRSPNDRACVVADPTGTPLNVRARPNGPITSVLRNGARVDIEQQSKLGGKDWALVRIRDTLQAGWVFRAFLRC